MGLRTSTVACLAVFYAASAQAGAWTQARGDGLFIGQATYFTSDAFYDADGILVDQPRFNKYELQPYAEYGLRDWLTVGGSLYLQRVDQSGTDHWGIGDPEIFARARVWRGERQVISIQPLIKLPSLYTHSSPPRGGSRSIDAELSVLHGRTSEIFSIPYYTDMRAGYRLRSGDLHAQYRFDASLGVYLSEDFLLIPAFRGVIAAGFDENAIFREDGEQDYDLMKVELTGVYHLNDKRWLQATIFDHVGGALTGNGRGIALGFAQGF